MKKEEWVWWFSWITQCGCFGGRLSRMLCSYLKEWRKHVESVDSAGSIWVSHKLVDVAPPGLLCVVTYRRLESCQDGRKKGRGRWGRTGLQQVVSLLLGQTERKEIFLLMSLCSLSGSNVATRYLGMQLSMSNSALWTKSMVSASPQWNSRGSSLIERDKSSSWALVSPSSWDTR